MAARRTGTDLGEVVQILASDPGDLLGAAFARLGKAMGLGQATRA